MEEVSTLMVSVVAGPGNTTPTAGETVIHFAPDVAVKEIGVPLVVSETVCETGGEGGTEKARVLALRPSAGAGGETTNVTGMVTGFNPVTVTVTLELYVEAGRLVGFTRTFKLAGSAPLLGSTVIHRSGAGVVAVNAGVPELALTETVWTLGSLPAPI